MNIAKKNKVGVFSLVLILTIVIAAGMGTTVEASTSYDVDKLTVGQVIDGGSTISFAGQIEAGEVKLGVAYAEPGSFINAGSYAAHKSAVSEIKSSKDFEIDNRPGINIIDFNIKITVSTAESKWVVKEIISTYRSGFSIEASALDADVVVYLESVNSSSGTDDKLDNTTGENDGSVKDETSDDKDAPVNPKTADSTTPITLSLIMLITLAGALTAGRAKARL